MILIADSGSTKTDWRILDSQGNISQAKTRGLNPYFLSDQEIFQEIDQCEDLKLEGSVRNIFFYGSGCVSTPQKTKIEQVLAELYPEAGIDVQDDLLGAARSLCNHDPGIACILGTGSNSCLYDGSEIVDRVPSLGFILGDEGSGSYLGKQLLSDYFKRVLPDNLQENFGKRFKISQLEIMDEVYHSGAANQFLASFTQFLYHHLKDPYVAELLYKSFNSFMERNVFQYQDHSKYQVHFVGSVAFYFSGVLRQVANDLNLALKNIAESPIAGLTLYHQDQKI